MPEGGPHLDGAGDAFVVEGLHGGAEILVDRWGIPHIYAGSARDAYLAQGFNAARDRLWQIDLWRRAGLGRLAEVLGADYVERDRAARLFLYRGSLDAEWQAYGCDLHEVIPPFVGGINAYVRLVAERPELLPPEFELLGYAPSEWSPEDVLRIRAHGTYHNVCREVARAQTLEAYGLAAEGLRMRLQPDAGVVVPEGLDLSAIGPEVLRDYLLATGPAILEPEPAAAPASGGSNNWAIAPERTASGRPIVANDPHRPLTVPALRYLAHVACPEWEIVGGGEPIAPGISIGHNGRIAFGLTILPIDQEDLYVYELDETGERYRYADGWEPFAVRQESIAVRGSEPVDVTLKFTRHGPVVHERGERGLAFAVRAAWLEPGMVPYLGSVALLGASDWEQFRRAARHWGAPGENLVYGDADGHVGWQAVGRVPIRRGFDGLLPVPGDGRFEWDGFLDPGRLPHELDPQRGWVATANQFNVPPQATGGVDLAFEWDSPLRHERIAECLDGEREATVASSARLQNDYESIAARRVVPLLEGLAPDDPAVRRAVATLTGWDRRLDADSPAAALFEVWFRTHLRRALFAGALAGRVPAEQLQDAVDAVLADESAQRDARIDVELLHALGPDRAPLLERTLAAAMQELEQALGPDPATWRWGALHHARFAHPLAGSGSAPGDVATVPRGGSVDTVGCAAYAPTGYREELGATLRVVIDVGDWDSSVAINAPGQSGDPRSPHYADLAEAWARDETIPLLYTRAAVEAATSHRIELRPPVRER